VINHRFDDALDQQEKKWKISSPHVYLGVPHTKSRLSTRSYGLPRIWWLPPNSLPPAKLQSPDHALELLLLVSSPTCNEHGLAAQGQEKRKARTIFYFQEKEETMKFPEKGEGNANK